MIKTIATLTTVITLCGITGGCTNLNGTLTGNVDPWTGATRSYYSQPQNDNKSTIDLRTRNQNAPYIDRATIMALSEEVDEIDLMFDQGGYNRYYDADFATNLTYTDNKATISMSWTSASATFPSGTYDILKTRNHNGREGWAFIDLVQQGVRKIVTRLDKLGLDYKVIATLSGSADGAPIRGRLLYNGEYGVVKMNSQFTNLNGTPYNFYIEPFQQINNEQLAALRAFSLGRLVSSYSTLGIENHYDVTVYTERGQKYRTAKVTISIEKNH